MSRQLGVHCCPLLCALLLEAPCLPLLLRLGHMPPVHLPVIVLLVLQKPLPPAGVRALLPPPLLYQGLGQLLRNLFAEVVHLAQLGGREEDDGLRLAPDAAQEEVNVLILEPGVPPFQRPVEVPHIGREPLVLLEERRDVVIHHLHEVRVEYAFPLNSPHNAGPRVEFLPSAGHVLLQAEACDKERPPGSLRPSRYLSRQPR